MTELPPFTPGSLTAGGSALANERIGFTENAPSVAGPPKQRMVSLFKPYYDHREVEAVAEVLQSGWIGLGPKTEEFEQRFAQRVGARHAVALNSCTAALEIALTLLDVGPGDEVVVPTITFVSSAHVVALRGAQPIFCDVDPVALCLDWEHARSRITARTKAIMPVVYSGQPLDVPDCDMPLVFDCAHAAGSGIDAGGKLCCWSFHVVKNLACGDGGMLTTDDGQLARRARQLRWLGIDKSTWDRTGPKQYAWEYDCREIGYKAHANDISAALGLVQLEKLNGMQHRRQQIAAQYCEQLDGLVDLPDLRDGHGWHLFVIRCDQRNELAEHLSAAGISTGVHYRPIHLYPCYADKPQLPVAEREWQ